VQAAIILTVPVVAVLLAKVHLFGPRALLGFWWTTVVLPRAQHWLLDETAAHDSRAYRVWTWVPSVMVLLHLLVIGYVHTIDFQPAFLAPFILGLVVTTRREQVVRQVTLPTAAVLCSVAQRSALGFNLFGVDALVVGLFRSVEHPLERRRSILPAPSPPTGCSAAPPITSRARDA
jgi:hypothetical protein